MEINQHVISELFTPENSSNTELGTRIRNEIESLAQHFIEIDDQEKTIKRSKKSIILEMADKFDRLHELGEYPFPIENICSSLYRYLQRKGFDIADSYIRRVLAENAPQYIHHSSSSSYQDRHSSSIDIKLAQDEIFGALKTLKDANISILKTEQIQDIIPSLYETLDTYEEHAQKYNITPAPSGKSQEAHYDSEDNDPFKEHIPCDKPDPRKTPSPLANATIQLGESIMKCGQTILNTGKMMLDYPPAEDDKEMEVNAVQRVIDWKQFWDLLTEALKGGTDRKYRRSILQWYKAALDEQTWGKHASSSKNPYLAKFRDPKTGEIKTEIRKLTREQLGDRSPKLREFANLFKQAVPSCLDFIFWSEDYLHAWTNGLSIKLHSKLQDRSLR